MRLLSLRVACVASLFASLPVAAAPSRSAADPIAARLDSLVREVAFLEKVLERKGIDLDRERRQIALADSAFAFPQDGSPLLGEVSAPLRLSVFLDVQCPYCVRILPSLLDFQNRHPRSVALEFRHFPLSIHPASEGGHRALWAAQNQGKFWEYLARIEANYKDLSDSTLRQHARALSLDLARFEADRAAPEGLAAIRAQQQLGENVGVEGTPTLYLNGRQVGSLDALEEAASRADAGR